VDRAIGMNLLRFDTESAWTRAICSLWRDRLRTNPGLTMCLPSGMTPVGIYEEMSRSTRAGLVSFAYARVYALDEFGGIGADDPGSTKNMLKRQLIDALDLAPGAFHYLDPAAPDLAQHCLDYDAAIADGVDLLLLGIGLNGHLGMNEPGSLLDGSTRRVDLHEETIQSSARYFSHGNLPRWGLTIGLKSISRSKEIWLIAKGPTKADIIQRTVRGEVGASNPASLLRRHPNCSLFVDADAGGGL
jgi:glucosamine-6-phosphate deaminase